MTEATRKARQAAEIARQSVSVYTAAYGFKEAETLGTANSLVAQFLALRNLLERRFGREALEATGQDRPMNAFDGLIADEIELLAKASAGYSASESRADYAALMVRIGSVVALMSEPLPTDEDTDADFYVD